LIIPSWNICSAKNYIIFPKKNTPSPKISLKNALHHKTALFREKKIFVPIKVYIYVKKKIMIFPSETELSCK